MAKLITTIAFIAASGAVPASSQNLPVDLRCIETDQALSQRLRDVVGNDDSRTASKPSLNLIMTRMASARFDCKHGRAERGLQTYADAGEALRVIEDGALPRTARSSAAGSTH